MPECSVRADREETGGAHGPGCSARWRCGAAVARVRQSFDMFRNSRASRPGVRAKRSISWRSAMNRSLDRSGHKLRCANTIYALLWVRCAAARHRAGHGLFRARSPSPSSRSSPSTSRPISWCGTCCFSPPPRSAGDHGIPGADAAVAAGGAVLVRVRCCAARAGLDSRHRPRGQWQPPLAAAGGGEPAAIGADEAVRRCCTPPTTPCARRPGCTASSAVFCPCSR